MKRFHGTKRSYFFNIIVNDKGEPTLEIQSSKKDREGRFIRRNIKIAFEDLERFKELLNTIE